MLKLCVVLGCLLAMTWSASLDARDEPYARGLHPVPNALGDQKITPKADYIPRPLGCYRDKWDRALRNSPMIRSFTRMTPEFRMEECRSLQDKHYRFAGVEAGSQCYCGSNNDYDRHGSSGDCDMDCSGDYSRVCGGDWAIEIYNL